MKSSLARKTGLPARHEHRPAADRVLHRRPRRLEDQPDLHRPADRRLGLERRGAVPRATSTAPSGGDRRAPVRRPPSPARRARRSASRWGTARARPGPSRRRSASPAPGRREERDRVRDRDAVDLVERAPRPGALPRREHRRRARRERAGRVDPDARPARTGGWSSPPFRISDPARRAVRAEEVAVHARDGRGRSRAAAPSRSAARVPGIVSVESAGCTRQSPPGLGTVSTFATTGPRGRELDPAVVREARDQLLRLRRAGAARSAASRPAMRSWRNTTRSQGSREPGGACLQEPSRVW